MTQVKSGGQGRGGGPGLSRNHTTGCWRGSLHSRACMAWTWCFWP